MNKLIQLAIVGAAIAGAVAFFASRVLSGRSLAARRGLGGGCSSCDSRGVGDTGRVSDACEGCSCSRAKGPVGG